MSPERNPDGAGAGSGGLYRGVRMSVRTVNILILVGIALLVAVTLFLVAHGGFTVSFDTDGGSAVPAQTRLHGELVAEPEPPVKEGFRFTGWYADAARAEPWDMAADTVTESLTLYAGWEPDAG